MSWKRSQARWEGEWHPAHTAHFYVKNMATMVCPLLIIVYQIKGLTSWWDAQECKEGLLTFFKTQFHLQNMNMTWKPVVSLKRERERERERDPPGCNLRRAKPNGNSMAIPKLQTHKVQALPMRQMLSLEVLSLFLGSIWAFYVTKWWQIKDDSICNFHEHLNWVMHYKKYAWKGTPVLKVYRYIIKICAH